MSMGGLIGALAVLGGSALAIWWAVVRTSASMPSGIARRLRRPDARHQIRLGRLRSTWNPGAPPTQRLYGPGTATYWRDAEQIHLDFQPRGGESQHLVGPLPAFAIDGTPAFEIRKSLVRSSLVPLVSYGATVLAGCAAGFLVTSGTTNARVTGAFVGGAATFLGGWLIFHVCTVVNGLRRGQRS